MAALQILAIVELWLWFAPCPDPKSIAFICSIKHATPHQFFFMTQTASVWLVVLLALLAANLPFISNRLFAVVALKTPKNLAVRLAELVVWYLLVGGLGLYLEQRSGQIAPQGWEFYAITGALFLTFAFPGFTYRYLFKHRA